MASGADHFAQPERLDHAVGDANIDEIDGDHLVVVEGCLTGRLELGFAGFVANNLSDIDSLGPAAVG